uniref:Peptidase aspartic putative domain-containing protein n=1 Tax=Trichuris muris TaxID=70415 RepID=A0A5S6Q0D4_TRIMR
MYSDPACSPDDWITDLCTSERISNSVPPSWLNEMAPAISIEPFDGDPLKWDMFISSFKSLVHDVVGSDAQRLAILRQLLSPVLRSALASSLQSPETYAVVLRDLRRLYGNTNAVVAASLRRLSCIEPMKARCDLDVERFYLELHGALNILRSRGRFVELRSAYTLQSVVPKLTYRLQHKWAQRAFDVRPKEATIEDLDSWLEQIVLMNRMVESAEPQKGELLNVKRSLPQVALKNRRRHLNLAMIADKEVQCVLCQDAHLLSMCPQFTNATPNQRAEILKEHGRCFACLDGVHQARHCPRKVRCSAPRCSQRHHHLLHGSSRVWPTAVDSQALVNPGDSRTATIGTNTVGCDSICLSVVPITVFADTLSVQTFALLDPGSQGTLVTDEVVRRLNLKKNSSNIRISTFHGNDPSLRVFSVDFSIRGRKDGQRFEVNGALVVPSLNLSSHVVNWNEERCKWPHLRDLPLNAIDYKKVSVLIGADNFDIMQPLELRKPPRKGQPFGVLTPLGWTVIGKLPQMFKPSQYSVGRTVNEIIVKKDGNFESELEIYERFWDTESFGTKPGANCRNIDLSLVSWPSSFEFSGGRYEVGLLWKTGNIALPNNRAMANGRFISLRKRLLGDPKLYGLYREAISSLSRSGIIRMVTTHEMNQPVGRVWYLPHHPVRHPLKPDKVRIVFDASAKFEGLSLNDQLSKGPDLTNDMTSILVRFRLLPVAVTSDVASMFHQVGVPAHDRSVLRFLWSGTVDTAPKTYEFTRQVFGLTSAPASCIYALTRCIHDFLPSEMASRLSRQFYVDNYLDSFLTSNEAIAHCVALKEATSKGGFPLVKWASTSSDVLRSFPENDCSQSNVDLSFGTHQMEGVLGLFWDCAKDVLRSQ